MSITGKEGGKSDEEGKVRQTSIKFVKLTEKLADISINLSAENRGRAA